MITTICWSIYALASVAWGLSALYQQNKYYPESKFWVKAHVFYLNAIFAPLSILYVLLVGNWRSPEKFKEHQVNKTFKCSHS